MSDKLQELLKLKSGGAYVPPAKLKALMANVVLEDDSEELQKLQWESLKKRINSTINKVNKENIREMVVTLFKLNLIRGKGLLCTNLMKAQEFSTSYTDVYASLICVINSKLPEIGKLLVNRLVMKYKRLLRRANLEGCKSIVTFLSSLVLFKLCNRHILMEIINQLLENPNDNNTEIALVILDRCTSIFYYDESVWFNHNRDILRNVLNENIVNTRTQFLIQEYFNNFKSKIDNENLLDEDLDLVDEEDCIVHHVSLNDALQIESEADVFCFDPNYKVNNEKYDIIRHDILGSDIESDDDDDDDLSKGVDEVKPSNHEVDDSDFSSDNEVHEDIDNEHTLDQVLNKSESKTEIKDFTEQELINYQKNVYLTIMSSMGPEEATHKLLKLPAIDPERKEYMLIDMLVKCCAQEKVYSKYYGIIGENLATINKKWATEFQKVFKDTYENCYKYETSLLRNLGSFWGHIFVSDKLGWECMSVVKLTENDTTSSGRIFLKFMFQRMIDEAGVSYLKERINEPYIQDYIVGIFPKTDPEHLRFSINFFTAIGMGDLTDKMREDLENLPTNSKLLVDESSDYSDSDDTFSDDSRGRSRERRIEQPEENLKNNIEHVDRVKDEESKRDRSYSRSRSNSRERSRSRSPSSVRQNQIPRGPRSMRGYGGGRYTKKSSWGSYRGRGNNYRRTGYRNDVYERRGDERPRR
ncbi:hypothetical protein CANINC_002817 [Pichia inconspicua]|uniref:Pre-mRNA-splicing factor CWC22 n=1 Tax=Pichia inconspicua TaxID=52247 RepID=A0A4T0X0K2_9ASCO|nr:hypothetical protein CANINC_002817 [[Candida] inconspicua]